MTSNTAAGLLLTRERYNMVYREWKFILQDIAPLKILLKFAPSFLWFDILVMFIVTLRQVHKKWHT